MNLGITNILKRQIKLGLDDKTFCGIRNTIDQWISSESLMPYGDSKFPPIFDDVLCVSMYDGELVVSLFEKDKLSLSEIHGLRERFSDAKFAIFTSFVPLFRKPKLGHLGFEFDDFIIGFALYDMVSKQILSLSIDPCSQIPFKDPSNITRKSISSYGRTLLQTFTLFEPYFHSCCPLPIAAEDYTPIPLLIYTLLDNRFSNKIRSSNGEELSLSEFFTFGQAPPLDTGLSSFSFNKEKQVTFVYLMFTDDMKRIAYELRFDYHRNAEFHVDFEVHTIDRSKQKKALLKHEEINLVDIQEIDPILLTSVLFAGSHDPYFDGIVDQHISGYTSIVNKNPFVKDYRKLFEDYIQALQNNPSALMALSNVDMLDEGSPDVKFLQTRKLLMKENENWFRTSRGKYVLDWFKREKLI